MTKLTLNIDGLTKKHSKRLRRRIASKRIPTQFWIWFSIGGVLFYAIHAFAPDLSGIWIMDSGSVVKISQYGRQVRAVYVKVDSGLVNYGFYAGDEHFVGRLEGRTLSGRMHAHYPISYKSKCPEKWAKLTDMELTVSNDYNSMSGRWRQNHIRSNTCEEYDEEWAPSHYIRSHTRDYKDNSG